MTVVALDKRNIVQILRLARRLLKRGGVLIYPTETSYGVGVDGTNAKAVARVFALKGRRETKPLSVLLASKKMARQYATLSRNASRLWDAFLPGALTLRVPAKGRFPFTRADGTVGIRVSSHPFAHALVRTFGKPITATSANLAEKPPRYSAKGIARIFRNRRIQPDLVLDAGTLPRYRASTVVDCTGNNVRLLRNGPISARAIRRALRS